MGILNIKKLKPKICRVCKQPFPPRNSLQIVCSPYCAINLVMQKKEQKEREEEKQKRKAWTKRKAAAKPLKHWEDMTQRVVNNYIRDRDIAAGYGCISCGAKAAFVFDAGHYRTVAAAPQCRYNPDNIALQCRSCNTHRSGNTGPYRIELVKRIGEERVQALENNHENHRYTLEELATIRAEFRAKHRELLASREIAA